MSWIAAAVGLGTSIYKIFQGNVGEVEQPTQEEVNRELEAIEDRKAELKRRIEQILTRP